MFKTAKVALTIGKVLVVNFYLTLVCTKNALRLTKIVIPKHSKILARK